MTGSKFCFANADDLSGIVALLAECSLPHEDIHEHLRDIILARDEARLIGSVALEVYGSSGLLRSLAVAQPYRNRGLGDDLLTRIVAHAHSCGVRNLFLLTTTAQRFFSTRGFDVVDRAAVPAEIAWTKEFRSLCPATAVCMAKDISGAARYYPADMLRLRKDVPGSVMWGVSLNRTMLTYFEVAPQSRFEPHSHESEQITMVLDGELFFEIEGRTVCLKKGEVLAIPAYVRHGAYTKDDPVRAIDAWSPVMAKYQ